MCNVDKKVWEGYLQLIYFLVGGGGLSDQLNSKEIFRKRKCARATFRGLKKEYQHSIKSDC